jgi:hypothetical protein
MADPTTTGPCPTPGTLLTRFRGIFLDFCVQEYVEELFSCFPTEIKVYLTHGDLLPRSILTGGSKITRPHIPMSGSGEENQSRIYNHP